MGLEAGREAGRALGCGDVLQAGRGGRGSRRRGNLAWLQWKHALD